MLTFSAWQLLTAIVFTANWWYVTHRPELLQPDVDHNAFTKSVRWNSLVGGVSWIVVILVALVNSTVAVVLILLSAVGWLVWHDLRTRVAGDP